MKELMESWRKFASEAENEDAHGRVEEALPAALAGAARIASKTGAVADKVGKVAGCMVTEGTIKRGCKVRLLRDNVVIHEGALKTLKRFKEEVREVREGFECGMGFENYSDLQEGDMIECFEIREVARTLD